MTTADAHAAARRSLLRDKIHLEPGGRAALSGSLDGTRLGRSAWAPARALADLLKPLPAEMLRWWALQPTGHAVIGGRSSYYQPGPFPLKRRTLMNVAHISPLHLARDRAAVWSALAGLFDHLLGCRGDAEGLWLSEGGGLSPPWQDVGRRIQESFQLGYAPEEAARSPRAYFAWGFAMYCTRRRELNVIDPLLERLFRTTILDARFWRRVSPRGGGE